jgi:hypothetical protein
MDYRVKVFLNRYFLSSMPDDEHIFKDYKSIEEFGKTLEGTKYYHELYLKAVNHPIRRKILEFVNESGEISKKDLYNQLIENKVISDMSVLDYNLDFLIKALCIEEKQYKADIFYIITQSGKIIEYLK